jgi:hypothetical protein
MEFITENIGWILVLITTTFILLYKWFTKDPNALTSKYTRTELIDSIPDRLSEIIIKSLKNTGFKNVGQAANENRYFAQSKLSMSSWTEYIEVKTNENKDHLELTFTSICAFPFQIFDWGKNKRNAKRFLKAFNNELKTIANIR